MQMNDGTQQYKYYIRLERIVGFLKSYVIANSTYTTGGGILLKVDFQKNRGGILTIESSC